MSHRSGKKTSNQQSNGSASNSKTGSNGQAPDAITLLTDDHQEVRDAFSQYEELGDKAYVGKQKLVDEICVKLLVHAQIEEEILYPEFVKAVKEGKDLEREARVEHASAKDLIRQLQSMESDEELYDAKVIVLSEYIEHHVKEEESEMFPMMRKAKMDIQNIGQRLWERKQELLQDPDKVLQSVVAPPAPRSSQSAGQNVQRQAS